MCTVSMHCLHTPVCHSEQILVLTFFTFQHSWNQDASSNSWCSVNCCCPFFSNVNMSVVVKHIIISGILDCMTYSLYPNIYRKLISEICRTFHFPFKSKARFILTVVVEVKRETIWSWYPISLISNIQMQNATFS